MAASNQNPQAWREKLAEKWWGVKTMDNALQLMKDRSEFNTVARLMKKQQDGTLGRPTNEEDEVGDLHFGDTTYHQQASSGLPAMALSAILGAGAAGGLGWWLSQPQPTEPQQPPAIEQPAWQQQGFVIKPGAPEGWDP